MSSEGADAVQEQLCVSIGRAPREAGDFWDGEDESSQIASY